MAVQKINFQNKSNRKLEPLIPVEQKLRAEDVNEIKNVVNNNADEFANYEVKRIVAGNNINVSNQNNGNFVISAIPNENVAIKNQENIFTRKQNIVSYDNIIGKSGAHNEAVLTLKNGNTYGPNLVLSSEFNSVVPVLVWQMNNGNGYNECFFIGGTSRSRPTETILLKRNGKLFIQSEGGFEISSNTTLKTGKFISTETQPTQPHHLANKEYVDGKLGEKIFTSILGETGFNPSTTSLVWSNKLNNLNGNFTLKVEVRKDNADWVVNYLFMTKINNFHSGIGWFYDATNSATPTGREFFGLAAHANGDQLRLTKFGTLPNDNTWKIRIGVADGN